MARMKSNRLIAALLFACGFASSVSAAAAEKINASYGAISGSMAQTWVAKEAKLFEKYGLTSKHIVQAAEKAVSHK